jgi:multidrug efflux pump
MEPFAAAMKGAQEIGFTVFSISMSLIAVFIPILLMGGIIGRLFREFAVTLATAIVISMVISLTTTPCMCAHVLKAHKEGEKHNWLYRTSESFFDGMVSIYRRSLTWVLDNPGLMLVVLLLTIALNVLIVFKIPTGFFPQQDTGVIMGQLQGPQDASFPLHEFLHHVAGQRRQKRSRRGPRSALTQAAATAVSCSWRSSHWAPVAMRAQSATVRQTSAMDVINRLRKPMNRLPVASAFLQPAQDLRIGGRGGGAHVSIHHPGRQHRRSGALGPDPARKYGQAA